jgi:hypothetical protein
MRHVPALMAWRVTSRKAVVNGASELSRLSTVTPPSLGRGHAPGAPTVPAWWLEARRLLAGGNPVVI